MRKFGTFNNYSSDKKLSSSETKEKGDKAPNAYKGFNFNEVVNEDMMEDAMSPCRPNRKLFDLSSNVEEVKEVDMRLEVT